MLRAGGPEQHRQAPWQPRSLPRQGRLGCLRWRRWERERSRGAPCTLSHFSLLRPPAPTTTPPPHRPPSKAGSGSASRVSNKPTTDKRAREPEPRGADPRNLSFGAFPTPPPLAGGGERKSVSSRHEPHSYFKTKNDTPFAKDPPPPALLPGWLARPASGSFHPEARTGFQREPRAAPRGWQLFGLGPGEGPDGFYHHHPPQAKMPRLLDEVRSSNGGADPFSRCKVLSIRFQRCRLTNVFCFLKQKSYGVLLIYEKRENNHLLTIRHWQCAIRICT